MVKSMMETSFKEKMDMKILKTLLPAALTIATALPAHALVINSIDGGGQSLAFSALNQFTAGPVSENGLTFTSTSSHSVYGYTSGYGLAGNGFWNGSAGPYIGLNTSGSNQFMTITFDNSVSSALAFLNYAPDYYGPAYIAAYDDNNALIESVNLSISTPSATNGGEDWGFGYSSSIIKSIVFGGAYIVAADLRVNRSAASVPEPSSLALLAAGMLGLGLARRFARK